MGRRRIKPREWVWITPDARDEPGIYFLGMVQRVVLVGVALALLLSQVHIPTGIVG